MPKFFKSEFTTDRIAKVVFGLLVLLAFVALVKYIWVVLVPFVIAWVTASLLEPLVLFLQQKVRLRNRTLSIVVALLLISGVVSGVVALLVPNILAESKKAWELISFYLSPELLLSLVPDQYRASVEDALNLDEMVNRMKLEEILKYAQSVFEKGWSILSGTLSILSNFTVVGLFSLYLFFIMIGYDALNKGVMSITPESLKPFVSRVGHDLNVYVSSYFRSQGLIALICGAILAIGFWIMGMPLGITMGILMGVLNMIPYMQLLGVPPIVLLCMLQSADTGQNVWILLIIAFAIMGLCQLLQDFLLTPLIMGREMGMHPAIILLSLSVWGFIWGFWGLIFALPLTMILYDLYMDYVVGGKPLDEPFTGKKVEPMWRGRKKKKEEQQEEQEP